MSSLDYSSASTAGTEVAAFWQDPEFKAEQQAFYYVRVLEIPTPRWSTYDAKTLGTEPMAPASIQERAITSSIWYKPDRAGLWFNAEDMCTDPRLGVYRPSMEVTCFKADVDTVLFFELARYLIWTPLLPQPRFYQCNVGRVIESGVTTC